MFLFDVGKSARSTLIRAMRAVARADGDESPKERALLECAHAALLSGDEPLDALAPFDPSEAAALPPADAERVVQSMLLMALMDGSGARAEAELIADVASRATVEERRVENLRQLAEGRLARMKIDLARRGYPTQEIVDTWREEGLRGLYRTFGPIAGLARDVELAQRYIALGELPAGTLGRAYFEFITGHDLAFPGERNGVAPRGLWHDMSHILGGYDTTPEGESTVVAFIAGFRRDDPFFWLFTIALQFQVGIKISPFSEGFTQRIDPATFVRHHKRGALLTADLSTDWRIEDDWHTDVETLRRRFNVLPLDAIDVTSR